MRLNFGLRSSYLVYRPAVGEWFQLSGCRKVVYVCLEKCSFPIETIFLQPRGTEFIKIYLIFTVRIAMRVLNRYSRIQRAGSRFAGFNLKSGMCGRERN